MDSNELRRNVDAVVNQFVWQKDLQSSDVRACADILDGYSDTLAQRFVTHLTKWETLVRMLYRPEYTGGLIQNHSGQRVLEPITLSKHQSEKGSEVVAEVYTCDEPGLPTDYTINYLLNDSSRSLFICSEALTFPQSDQWPHQNQGVIDINEFLTPDFKWSGSVGKDIGMSWSALAVFSNSMEHMLALSNQTHGMLLDAMYDTELNPGMHEIAISLRQS